MDSVTVVKSLSDVDPGFVELCKTLFGDAIDAQDAWDYLYGDTVVKMNPDSADLMTRAKSAVRSKKVKGGALVALGGAAGAAAENRRGKKKSSSSAWGYSMTDGNDFGKADQESDEDSLDVVWAGEFSKVDTDKREVFGWASVVELDGKPIVDRQGDLITPEEIERAAYTYVVKSRKGGRQHRRTDTGDAFHASDMIESVVFTDEKIEKMGLPDDFPRGWWVGYKVNDDDTWDAVKKQEVTSFSIHGRGKRQQIAEVGE